MLSINNPSLRDVIDVQFYGAEEVLGLLVEGLTNREIAGALSVTVGTVKTHVSHILEKLQVRTRHQAAAYAQGLKADRNRVDHHTL
mgnify:CR=1 FL=1